MIDIPEVEFSYGPRFTLRTSPLTIERFPAFLVGANGSGKTTFLRIIGGFVKVSSSPRILLNGKWVPTRPHHFAYLPAQPNFEPSFSVRNYLLLTGNHAELESIANELELRKILDYRMGTLSSGWLQRVLIARILLQPTPYVLMDEPTSFLDPEARKELITILSMHTERKMVVSSHDLAFVASFGNLVVGLRDGRVVFAGEPKMFFKEGIDEVFLKGYVM